MGGYWDGSLGPSVPAENREEDEVYRRHCEMVEEGWFSDRPRGNGCKFVPRAPVIYADCQACHESLRGVTYPGSLSVPVGQRMIHTYSLAVLPARRTFSLNLLT